MFRKQNPVLNRKSRKLEIAVPLLSTLVQNAMILINTYTREIITKGSSKKSIVFKIPILKIKMQNSLAMTISTTNSERYKDVTPLLLYTVSTGQPHPYQQIANVATPSIIYQLSIFDANFTKSLDFSKNIIK